MRLTGKTALVTGNSQGIGEAVGAAVTFLASPPAGYNNGANLRGMAVL
jgi:hypothetical protein